MLQPSMQTSSTQDGGVLSRMHPVSVGRDGHFSFSEQLLLRRAMEASVRRAGERLLAFTGAVRDRHYEAHGHIGSTADDEARYYLLAAVEEHLTKMGLLDRVHINLGFEDRPMGYLDPYDGKVSLSAVIDELDGTRPYTTWLRSKSGLVPAAPPHSAVSIMIADTTGEPFVSAVYALDTCHTFTALRVEGDVWMSFVDGKLITALDLPTLPAQPAVLVAGYSNRQRRRKAELEERLIEAGFSLTEGHLSSTQDILGLVRGSLACYVDARAIDGDAWGACLRAYDVAGVVPMLWGLGLAVRDVFGRPLPSSLFASKDITVSLVVGGVSVVDRVIEAIQPAVK